MKRYCDDSGASAQPPPPHGEPTSPTSSFSVMASPMHGAGGSAIDALVDEIQDMMAQTPDTPPLQAASPPLPPLPPPRAIDTTRRPSEPVRRPMVRRLSLIHI